MYARRLAGGLASDRKRAHSEAAWVYPAASYFEIAGPAGGFAPRRKGGDRRSGVASIVRQPPSGGSPAGVKRPDDLHGTNAV